MMLDKRLTKRPALRLEDRDRPVHGPCGLSRTDAQAGVRRSSHKDGTLEGPRRAEVQTSQEGRLCDKREQSSRHEAHPSRPSCHILP